VTAAEDSEGKVIHLNHGRKNPEWGATAAEEIQDLVRLRFRHMKIQ
jgi:hypothetical protein